MNYLSKRKFLWLNTRLDEIANLICLYEVFVCI